MQTTRSPGNPPHSGLAQAGRTLLFAVSAVPAGAGALAVLIAGWTTSLSLAVTPLVVGALIGFGLLVRVAADVEAELAAALLDTRTGRAARAAPVRGFWRRGLAVLGDGGFWRTQAYLVLRVIAGWPIAVALITLFTAGLGGLSAFVWYRWIPRDGGGHGLDFGIWQPSTLGQNLLLVPAGALVVCLAVALLRPTRALWRTLATALLPEGSDAVTRPIRTPADHRRALVIHASISSGIVATLTLIWALTSRAYFWPFWVLLPCAAVLGAHALVVEVHVRPSLWRHPRTTKPFALHAGLAAILFLFLAGVWAATTRWYFWPVWPLLGLALTVLVHWGVLQTRRIEHLETARTNTVEVQETDLRRIERDLHDGAQARLVALGINLGMAEQRFDTDPASARALVTEARGGVTDALREIRDLVRGIRPPVLADRGLEAAISALADRHPLLVEVTAHVEPRPTDPVETAAYFVVAEALTNAAKHARATRVDVRLERHGPMLQVEIVDDGRGAADPSGAGLTGLRRRVEALDGSLTVSSPAGGPTVIRAELPCGS